MPPAAADQADFRARWRPILRRQGDDFNPDWFVTSIFFLCMVVYVSDNIKQTGSLICLLALGLMAYFRLHPHHRPHFRPHRNRRLNRDMHSHGPHGNVSATFDVFQSGD